MMNTMTLNNDIQMPMLGFGTFLMGGAECEESVLTALRSGYRMIDTAEAYGNEEAVGNAIEKSGIAREELFLVTKVNFRSYENTRAAVEASMEKLKTNYLDLVLLHCLSETTMPHGGSWKSCIRREKSGLSVYRTSIRTA